MTVAQPPARRSEHSFFTWAAVLALLIIFAGFSRSYYLKRVFGAPELPLLRHVHGAVMTLWFLLFIVQTRLIAARKVALHRQLGVAGAVLAALVVVLGCAVAIAGARRGATPGPPPLVFMAIPMFDLVVFAILVGAGLLMRRRAAWHKRLMLLSTISFLPPAVARLPLGFIPVPTVLMAFVVTDLFVLTCVGIDSWKHRRLHPAFGWGALLIIVSHPLRFFVAGTSVWLQFATWMTS